VRETEGLIKKCPKSHGLRNGIGKPIPYGLAAEFVLDGMPEKPGIRWSRDLKADFNADGRSDWMNMGEIAESCGLEWGGCWKRFPDLPHIQNTYGFTPAEIREIYCVGYGIRAVWEEFRAA
jgi:hypothetical protein